MYIEIAHLQSLLVAAPGHHHGQAEQACGEASFVQPLADHLLFVCYVISKLVVRVLRHK